MVEGTRKGTSRAENGPDRREGTHGDRWGSAPLAGLIAIDVSIGEREVIVGVAV